MKLMTIKFASLLLGIFLACTSGAYAEETQDDTLMNKDQVNGKVEESKGKVKEATGVILDDKAMKKEGNVQKNLGKAQSGVGDIKKKLHKDIKEGN
ncbi:CsbD family protein [Crenothrix polyspora]|jgi:uncharacterized protein YjbJ (UPF0337 family)|uniref:CsbD-like domain-containing protein n=1 Tax=Crenothrix polyspora TaxID=360316 RepID=A0A1R4HIT5_9GAMM|nr:CsbD family protein [Crenothrix polyspora]SJM96168.1 conserved exported hypothetical protein [Crenothrix polyspora]